MLSLFLFRLELEVLVSTVKIGKDEVNCVVTDNMSTYKIFPKHCNDALLLAELTR